MKNRINDQARTPEQLASFLADGHRVWIKGHLYEVFKRSKYEDSLICEHCNSQGKCPSHVYEVCKKLGVNSLFRYGLRKVK